MRRTLLLGAALVLTSPLLAIPSQAAGTALPQTKWAQSAAADGSIVEKAGWRRRCRRWNAKCSYRWGWQTGRYWRCMRRHNC
jgi:alpha-beta hydrolase superfamily lysophospholipase